MTFIRKYLVITVIIFLPVGCRKIHKNRHDTSEVRNNFKKGIKEDHAAIEKLDLDNCKDCVSAINNKENAESKKNSQTSDGNGDFSEIHGETKRHKQVFKSGPGRHRKAQKKSAWKHDSKRTHLQRKHKKKFDKESMVPDATDNVSQDRWRTQKLKQLPGVARLEQRLHPTVKNPIHKLMMSLNKILQIMKDSVGRVDLDHKFIFNATRHDIMMNVRKELTNIADGSDEAYDAVLQASLLTKDIYRRAHRERRLGPRTLPAAVSSDTLPKLLTIPLREHYMLAREELHRANRLKRRITLTERERYELETRLMQVQRRVEGSLPARTLKDLVRISNHTLRVLQSFAPRLGSGGRIHLYGHMYRNTANNVRESRDMLHDSKNVLTQIKSQITMGRSLRNQILRRVRDGTSGAMSDMPFDDSRMILWATVDSARHHADTLVKTAADLHMKLTPILQKAQELLAERDKNTISRRLEETTKALENQILALATTLDKICVEIDDDDILRSRCEAKQTSDRRYDGVIDCDAYLPEPEGSGLDEDLEGSGEDGSGDLLNEDIIIPLTKTTGSAEKSIDAPNNQTKTNAVIISKEIVTVKGVTGTTDDEDMLSKKPKSAVTTTATPLPRSVEPLLEDISENDTEDDDFMFTDWFGILGDDPMVWKNYENKLNTLILERLAVYSKGSVEVFATTDKTKEALEDLSAKWNDTKRSFEGFENSVLSTKVFIHKWAAKNLYFSTVHDRVMSLKDHVDLQSEVIEKQCSEAIAVAERKLEAAQERQTLDQNKAETAADPDVVKEAVDAIDKVKESVQSIVQLKRVNPDPCGSMQILDNTLRTNMSELRQNIAKAKEIASSLQVPVSLQGDGYLTIPVEGDDTKTSRMTLSMNVKPGDEDGPVALVRTEDSGSVVVSVKNNAPVLTVLDDDDYDNGQMALDLTLDSNTTYDVLVERLGSMFSMFVYNILDNSLLANNSFFIESVHRHQKTPTTVYIAGAPENFPTFGTGLWQGCLSHVSINGKYLSLLGRHSGGNMTRVCSDIRFGSEKESLVLGGTGYTRLSLEPISSLSRGAMDSILIQFKAYSDGDLLWLSSSRTRSLESVQIESGRIRLDFKNHYGQVLLQSKGGIFSYGKEHVLQITTKASRQLELDVSLDGTTDAFETLDTSRVVVKITETALFIGGLPSSLNRSLAGCIKKLVLNEEDVTFILGEESIDVYRGMCVEPNCVKFVEDSVPINLGESSKRNSIEFAFTYGSKGTIIDYSKEKKLELTITVEPDGLDIGKAVGDISEHINLGNHSVGDAVNVLLKATKDEVKITVDGISKEVSYDSDCGWLGCGSEEDKKYSIILGGTSEDTTRFEGNLIYFFMNGRPLDTRSFMESNNLQRCVPPRKHRKPEDTEVKDIERSVC